MTVRKENDGTYTVFHSARHPMTKRSYSLRRVKVESFIKAKRIEKELVKQLIEKFRQQLVISWDLLVEKYVNWLNEQEISKKSVEVYRLSLEAHTLDSWNSRLITSITSNEIRELIHEKVGHRSLSQQKNLLKYIRGAFSFAVENNLINRNPVPKMKFKIGRKLKEVLTEVQVNILLTQAKVLNSDWYPIWCMALYTGMRNGELYALTWDKINLEDRRIKVDCSWNKHDGFKDTKSGDDRILEIAPALLTVLKELKIQNLNPPFVLPRIDKWDKGEQARELRRFLEGCGLPRIRFHDLRASWATIMLSKGIPPIKVMSMGGWRDLKTMQFYIRKAGVNINGITDNLELHNPSIEEASVFNLNS